MLEIIVTLVLWAAVVLLAEALWRAKILRGEYSRKTTHIGLSLVIAFMPFYLSWPQIYLCVFLGIGALIVIRSTNLIKSIHDIKRHSFGDIIIPATLLVVALVQPPALIFTAVVLFIGLPDGMAAIIGTKYGRSNSYSLLGYTKSVVGSAAFLVTAMALTAGLIYWGNLDAGWSLLIWLPLATTFVEIIGIYGIDNGLIATVVYLVLTPLI